jgi:hypothetical protein
VLIVLIFVAAGVMAVLLVHVLGSRDRSLTPIGVFLGMEIVATWPALMSESLARPSSDGIPLAVLTAAATLAAVTAYLVFAGAHGSVARWRDPRNVPVPDRLRALGAGIWFLVSVLSLVSIWRLGGVPPMLTGGFSSLIDPLTHADKVAEIRETRRVLTKGYLVGETYQGQGILNALTEAGWQVAVIAAVLRYGWDRSSASLRQLIAVGALTFVFLGSMGQRSPLVLAFLVAAGAAALQFRFSTRRLTAFALVGFAFLLFISPLSKGEAGGTGIVDRQIAIARRITEGNGQHNVAIVRLVDSGVLEARNGGLFVDLTLLMVPGAPAAEPFTLTVTRLTQGVGANTTAFSTPTNFGYLYADGKETAVILGYGIVGAVMGLLWRFLLRMRSYVGAILLVQGAVLLGYMSVTGIQGFAANAAMTCVSLAVLLVPQQLSDLLQRRHDVRLKARSVRARHAETTRRNR